MRSIERNKIAAIGLLVVVVIGVIQATPDTRILTGDVEYKLYINGNYPKVGEVFEVVFRVRLKSQNDLQHMPEEAIAEGYVVSFGARPKAAVKLLSNNEIFIPVLNLGEWQEFVGKYRITKPSMWVTVGAEIRLKAVKAGPGLGHTFYLLDSLTGQYGTKEQWLNRGIGVLGKYNNVEPQWLSEPDRAWEPSNRKIAQEIRKFEPALIDSEALCLHQDNYLLIINAIGDPNATDSERIEHLLKADWLNAQRSGVEAKENWFNEFMDKNRGNWGGNSNLNFFRDNNSSGIDYAGNNSSSQERITTTFIGTWRYQDHLYNKDNGLLWSYAVKPVKTAEVGIRAYWLGQGQIFVGWGSTDSSGNFTITTELIPYGATNVRAFPILYAWGPDRFNEKIKVSDPDTSISTWKNPRDRTIWWLPRPTGTPANYVTPGGTCNFSICYPETATAAITQPRSGAANILETYFHARTFTSPPPTSPLRIMWEPGYDTITCMNMLYTTHDDSIWVCGESDSAGGTDEWDDDILLEEYGHYLMKYYAEGPPTCSGMHKWPYSYPNRPGIGYGEGWSYLFSCRAKVGSSTDTLIVNTGAGIGGDSVYLWRNIENPWIASDFPPEFFQGGPWCEGAVAGALWDIYDSKDEIPYHSYPYPGFPDTALADTLTVDFDTIWTVFDDYNPPGEPTHCWTIFDFRSGWNSYNYGHQFALNQILLHHRIQDSIPAAPIGLSATLENYNVRLYWHKNTEPDLEGYRIFRRGRRFFGGYSWSDWAKIAEKNSPTDTTHLDATIRGGWTYQYKLTAFDTLHNESKFSDSVEINVPQKNIDGMEPLGLTQTIFANVCGMEISIPQEIRQITLKIYDCCGRIVNERTIKLSNGNLLKINLRDAKNNHLSNGIYFLHLKTDNCDEVMRKFVVIR
jgi:hypothetical protein